MAEIKSPITDPWKVKEIVYVSLVGPVLLAAVLEWFLWLAAFFYCLLKAFQKANHWSQRVLAVMIAVVLLIFR